MTRQMIFGAACVVACLAFGGCFKEKRDVTLNPDGSGKMTYEYRGPMQMMLGGDEKPDPKEQSRKEAARILSESEGVSAWKDVSFEVDGAGMLTFKGTAYFKTLNKLNIQGGGGNGLDLKPAWDATSPAPRLELAQKKETKAKVEPVKLTDAEVAQKAAAAKAEFKKGLPMLVAMLSDLRVEWSFALPGAPDQTVNFQKAADRPNTVRIVYDGAKILEVMNALANDDAFWKAEAAAGRSEKDGPPRELLNEKLFGARGPVAVTVKPPLKAQFDYPAEVAAAQAGFKAMTAALKLDAPAPASPASGGAFKSLRVGGARVVNEADHEKQITPFSWQKGYTLALIGELPGAALAGKGGLVETAVADNGEDLLPEKDWDRKIQWPRLSKDGCTMVFECPMAAPGPKVKGIKELSGTVAYTVANGTKEVNLGTVALKAGTQAKELGAKIESLGKSWKPGSFEVRLSLKTGFQSIKDVKFFDAAGQEIGAKPGGRQGGDREVTLTFTKDGEFPPEARIVVTLFDDLKDYTIGFKLENVDLLGRPMK